MLQTKLWPSLEIKNYYSNEVENEYSLIVDESHQKSLGQYFTPFEIATFMADWILGNHKSNLHILDPAAGLGIFTRAIIYRNNEQKKTHFNLWEIDGNLAAKLGDLSHDLNADVNVINDDFLSMGWDATYDAIIANPPYYKHHYINNKNLVCKEICDKTSFNFSIQTNIYCWFLVKAINLLKDKGRLAFIIPSEFFNSNYGEKVKDYLIKSGTVQHLININFQQNVFDNALTTSVIILAEKNQKRNKIINFYNITDTNMLNSDLNVFLKQHPRKSLSIDALDSKLKWRNYFNGWVTQDLKNLCTFSEVGKFSRGIATGANEYFTLTPSEKNKFNIPDSCLVPCITKANYAKDIKFTEDDFNNLIQQNKKVFLFDAERDHNANCTNYLKLGESGGIHKRFLTKHRDPWYAIEKRTASRIWASVFGRNGLKFIWNDTECKNLTCFHAFYPTTFGEKYLDILFIYLNTAFAKKHFEVEKREYGNGLEKFEPNDINKSLILNFNLLSKIDFENLKQLQVDFLQSEQSHHQNILLTAEKILNQYN